MSRVHERAGRRLSDLKQLSLREFEDDYRPFGRGENG